jgi:predicted O-linked N-acetylglucosamine transferase (SPINDLY family)
MTVGQSLIDALRFRAEGLLPEAEAAFRKAAREDPADARPVIGLGALYNSLGQHSPAHVLFSRAVTLNPESAPAWDGLGLSLIGIGRDEEAVNAWQLALVLDPNRGKTHFSLGAALASFGDHERALAALGRAHELMAASSTAHSNLIQAMHYAPGISRRRIFAEHRRWNDLYTSPKPRPPIADPDPERTIRVGFVSDDFRFHAVYFFFHDTFTGRPRDRWRGILYANQTIFNDCTHTFMEAADIFRDVHALDDETLARQIHDDGIDILIDLDGHTKGSRLPVFALRPAPVQVTFLDYVDTSGLDAMDFIIADEILIPAEFERYYTEEVIRLPGDALCYRPPGYAPRVSPPSAGKNGYITFGCFNTAHKISTETVALWSRVLDRVDRSRLLLNVPIYRNQIVRERYSGLFEGHGIGRDRIEFGQGAAHELFLGQYRDVDIAFDTTPYSSGLNTCEALWMGVPVIALAGDRQSARLATSHVLAAGFPEYAANDKDDFVEKAATLAADIPALAERRQGQRQKVAASALCDRARYTAHFTEAIETIWRKACAAQKAGWEKGGGGR